MESSFARAHIDLSAIKRNFASLGPATRLIPVIKSDAYGHGIVPVAKVLSEAGAEFMATATVDEGLVLRKSGIMQKILILLGCKTPEEARQAGRENMIPVVYNEHSLALAKKAGKSLDKPLKIAVKFNSGMARLGFAPEEAQALADSINAIHCLEPVLVMSHMAASDCQDEDDFTEEQAKKMLEVMRTFKTTFPAIKSSLPASAGTLRGYIGSFDFARPGIALYGGNPLAGSKYEHLGTHLETAMSVSTPILQIRNVRAGQTVGYGRTFKADHDIRVAVLSIGYADGYARCFSGRGEVALGSGRAKVLGRVCMGMIMVDLSSLADAHDVREGDQAFILGGKGFVEQPVGIQELCASWGTIPYEIFCLLGSRNVREYNDLSINKDARK